jgi:hypothetical protein
MASSILQAYIVRFFCMKLSGLLLQLANCRLLPFIESLDRNFRQHAKRLPWLPISFEQRPGKSQSRRCRLRRRLTANVRENHSAY